MKFKKFWGALVVAIAAVVAITFVFHVNAQQKHDSSTTSSSMSSMKMNSSMKMGQKNSTTSNMKMDGMKMHGSAAPKSLKMAMHPKFKVGSKVMIMSDHMSGMKGAKATVVGAYNTKLYTIDFTNTKTHKMVMNHKYVVAPEIKGDHKVGSKITVEADHMTGMKGAKGKIVAITNGPAYMVNYTPTNSKMMVTNHKWLSNADLMMMK